MLTGPPPRETLALALSTVFHSNPVLACCAFAIIAGISVVIPLAFIWTAMVLLELSTQHLSFPSKVPFFLRHLLTAWSLAEIGFFFYMLRLQEKIQAPPKVPFFSCSDREFVVSHVMSNVEDGRTFLSRWFFDAPLESLHKHNITEWVAFAFWGVNLSEMSAGDAKDAADIVERMNDQLSLGLRDGHNPSVSFMRHVIDPVNYIGRPFIYYAVTDWLLGGLGNIFMRCLGYTPRVCGVISFWVSTTPSASMGPTLSPLIILHGIGSGLLMYAPLILHLHRAHASRRRMVVLSYPSINMRFPSLADIPNRTETVHSVSTLLGELDTHSAVFLGHSYGTVFISWILQEAPRCVDRVIFIDPVCFELNEPDIIFNFVYQLPHSVGQLFMWFFVCREPGIAHVIARHFWWFQNILFASQLPGCKPWLSALGEKRPTSWITGLETMLEASNNQEVDSTECTRDSQLQGNARSLDPISQDESVAKDRVRLFLSEDDCIVNSRRVLRYLAQHGLPCHVARRHVHGTVLMHPDSWRIISSWV